jgi:hypothetical protein
MYANPGDIPELVALLREPDGNPESQLVEVINVSTLQSVAGWSSGGTPETFPASGTLQSPREINCAHYLLHSFLVFQGQAACHRPSKR